MRRRKTSNLPKIIITIIILAAIGILGWMWYTKTGIFHTPGNVGYADSLSPEQQATLDEIFAGNTELELDHDVVISLETNTKLNPDLPIYDIRVPVTDFYASTTGVTSAEVTANSENVISVLELTNQQKLLELDGVYYLDSFVEGAFFLQLQVTGREQDVVKITTLLEENLLTFPNSDSVLTLAQTGVTALTRGMTVKLNEVGDATYFAANIGEFLSRFDLTHTSNEASFTNLAAARNICADPRMLNTLLAIGLDIVELTGNHNLDCGADTALNTLEIYAANGIQTFGGGANATDGATPLELSKKGTNITMLGYNLSTGGYTLGSMPGANFYTTEKARADINAAKARGDFIIVDVQYYECNEYDNTVDSHYCDFADSAAGDQIGLFREIIDLGADVVVGTSAHQPQTYELYGNGVIYYGLGNLFFDQIWWPGTTRSLVLIHYFYNGKLLQTRIVPTIYGDEMQTRLMDTTSAEAFLKRLVEAKPEA